MKVLVATRESQGARDRDVWLDCVEGELVRPIEERCLAAGQHDCSCQVAFLGLASAGLTSTAVVADLPHLTPSRYTSLLRQSLTARERRFVRAAPYAGELARVAGALRGTGAVERWDEWIGLRFDEDGELRPDISALADLDPDELDDLDELDDVD